MNSISRVNNLCTQLLAIITENRDWKEKAELDLEQREKANKKPELLLLDLYDL